MMATMDRVSANSRCAMQQQAMQRHDLRLQRVQLDQRQVTFGAFAPPVYASLGFLHFAAVGPAQKFARVFRRSCFAQRGSRQRFHRIAAQQLAPVLRKEMPGSKDIAPSHFAAISDDNADNALALQSRSSARETP